MTFLGGELPNSDDLQRLRELRDSGELKRAYGLSKACYEALKDDETEALFIELSLHRVEELLLKDMALEAEAVLDILSMPAAREAEHLWRARCQTWQGVPGELVAPLVSSETSQEEQRRVYDDLRRWLTNPAALAACEALPEDHELRRAAAAVARAFEAVTSRQVTDDEIALGEVSRRSPLAPWKLLIRGIAELYRGDDEACLRALKRIPNDAASARLKPSILAIIAEDSPRRLSPSVRSLVGSVSGDRDELRKRFVTAERALQKNNQSKALKAVSELIKACKARAPELVERTKSHLAARLFLEDYSIDQMHRVLGSVIPRDAYFWALLAKNSGIEALGAYEPNWLFEACAYWDQYRRQAIKEGIFSANSREEALCFLQIIGLLEEPPLEDLEFVSRENGRDFERFVYNYCGGSRAELVDVEGHKVPFYLVHEELFRRAAAANPEPSMFELWHNWVRSNRSHWKPADEVALTWHEKRPKDSRPLMLLVESAEQRGALKKAAGYLDQAQELEGATPAVKSARRRLILTTFEGHLKKGKDHLAACDVDDFEALAEAGQRAEVVAGKGLRWLLELRQGRLPEASALAEECVDLVGDQLTANLFLKSLAVRFGAEKLTNSKALPMKAGRQKKKELIPAVARACELSVASGLNLPLALEHGDELIKALDKKSIDLTMPQLRSIAQVARSARHERLLFAVAGRGLRLGGAEAYFLKTRGEALSYLFQERRKACLRAALELARRQGDRALVDEILELQGERSFYFSPFMRDQDELHPMSNEEVEAVIRKEKRAVKYPSKIEPDFFYQSDFDDNCQCDDCRRRRGELPPEPRGRGQRRASSGARAEQMQFPWELDDEDDESDELFDEPDEAMLETLGAFMATIESLPAGLRDDFMNFLLEVIGRFGMDPPSLPELEAEEPALAARLHKLVQRFAERGVNFPLPILDPDSELGGKRS